jgi:hypothetical protein
MLVTPLGIVTLVRGALINAQASIVVTPLGTVNDADFFPAG